jgi:cytochrome bd-I ubiquinol oxidase subunit X
MWYFTWILGLALAASFSILNALWLEISPQSASGVSGKSPEASL